MTDPTALQQMIATDGVYPTQQGTLTPSFCIGMIQTYAGPGPVYGAPLAQGQPYQQSDAIYPVIGNAYGDNGPGGAIVLPNLEGIIAVGGGFGAENGATLAMSYLIAAENAYSDGIYPAPVPGMVIPFAGNFAPDGWLMADGGPLSVEENPTLFAAIGTTFGGDGVKFYTLPQLNGAAVIGAGGAHALGHQVYGDPALGLALNYLICTQGEYPESGGVGAFPATDAYLGQVIAFAGSQVPQGWTPCDGRLLGIGEFYALFDLIGTAYGGDGQSTFGIPDLRDAMIIGAAS